MTYRDEFPDFADMPDVPADWRDSSWHNNICPSFDAAGFRVWIDRADPDQREIAGRKRFMIVEKDSEDEASGNFLLETDDWQAVLDFIKYRTVETMIFAHGKWEFARMEWNPVKAAFQWVRRDGSFICMDGQEKARQAVPPDPA